MFSGVPDAPGRRTGCDEWALHDSNLGPIGYEPTALTAELRARTVTTSWYTGAVGSTDESLRGDGGEGSIRLVSVSGSLLRRPLARAPGGQRMSLHGRLAALGLLVCALSANAAPKITIAPITGDKKSQVGSQISATLCRKYTCVPSSRVFTKKKPDWNKMKSAQVSGLLVGGVAKAKSGKGKEVQLSWLDKPGKAAQNWSFPLTSAGKLTNTSLQTLATDVGTLASGGGDATAGAGAVGAVAAGS